MSEKRYELRERLGLNSAWNPKDRDIVIRFNRKLWNRFRKKYFEKHEDEIREELLRKGKNLTSLSSHNFPNACIPGFLKSIQSFHIDYGLGFTDIGTYFGLTGEGVAQQFEEYGLRRRKELGSMFMVWDEEKKFIPITNRRLEIILIDDERKKEEEKRREKREEIKQEQKKAIQDFRMKRGREPNLRELSESLGYSVTPSNRTRNFSSHWGYNPRDKRNSISSSSEAIDDLYRAAGATERPGRGGKMRSLV